MQYYFNIFLNPCQVVTGIKIEKKQNFTIQGAADYFKVTRQTIPMWIINAILPVQYIGRQGLIESKHIKRVTEAREVLGFASK